jgi:predicted MFS family arabinose efflux permease
MPASGLVGTGLVWALSFAWGDKVSGMGRMMILSGAIAAAGAILFALIREMKVAVPVREHLEADHRAVFRLGLPLAVIGLGAGLTIPFINLYFEHRFHFTPRNVSVAFSAAQMVSFFAFLASPLLARRFGGVRTVIACQLLSIPFFLVMAFTGLSSLAVAAFLARHALMNMAGPVTSQFAMEVVSPHKRVRTNGLIESSRNGTFLLGTAAGGWVIDARLWGDGYTATMLMTIALYLTGSAIFYFFWRTSSALTPRATPTPIHELDS